MGVKVHYYGLVVGELMGPVCHTHEGAYNWASDRMAAWRKPVRVEVYIQVGEESHLLDVMEITTVGVAKYHAVSPNNRLESYTYRGAVVWANSQANRWGHQVEVYVRIHGKDTLIETIRPEQ
jgi:hypothetical protein